MKKILSIFRSWVCGSCGATNVDAAQKCHVCGK